ncbi:MAG: succinate dehydrogenase iron-sulfur subunit [Planctomycetes bacterium]|nr:succinate dehydrogenase iron-sulfur subunit [Planctomycetota bacterium]
MATFHIFRFDPTKDKTIRFDRFEVPDKKGLTVLDGLYYILENLDGSLAFRSSCRAGVCGSCAMHINGQYRLSCTTSVKPLGKNVTIRPLAHLPVLKDLVVDLTNFFRHYEKIKPYLITNDQPPKKEFIQQPAQRKKIESLIDCILCGACYGSCPVAAGEPNYLGPHALLKAARFIFDSRDTNDRERINLINHNLGVFRCHTIFNCQQVCPKKIDPSEAIARMKMKTVWSKLRGFFGS